MSKSRGNIVIPDAYIKKYGADTLRTYLMFLGPFDHGGDFRDTGIAGMYRFLSRVWRLVNNYKEQRTKNKEQEGHKDTPGVTRRGSPGVEESVMRVMHRTIKEVTEDMENLRYNTAIAHLMEYVNVLTNNQQLITNNHIKSLLLMLAPLAPHLTEELWSSFDFVQDKQPSTINSIHLHPWPSFDPKYLVEDEVTIVVQVNGKLRDRIKVPFDIAQGKQNGVEEIVRKSEKVQKFLSGKSIRKVIFVPGKLINFVV